MFQPTGEALLAEIRIPSAPLAGCVDGYVGCSDGVYDSDAAAVSGVDSTAARAVLADVHPCQDIGC